MPVDRRGGGRWKGDRCERRHKKDEEEEQVKRRREGSSLGWSVEGPVTGQKKEPGFSSVLLLPNGGAECNQMVARATASVTVATTLLMCQAAAAATSRERNREGAEAVEEARCTELHKVGSV